MFPLFAMFLKILFFQSVAKVEQETNSFMYECMYESKTLNLARTNLSVFKLKVSKVIKGFFFKSKLLFGGLA